MDRVLKWFAVEDKETVARLIWFTESFRDMTFQGTDAVLLQFLCYCANLGVCVKRKYLEVFLQTEGKKVIKKGNIRLDSLIGLNYDEPGSLEEAYRVIASATLVRYDACVGVPLGDSVFKVEMSAFISKQKAVELQRVMAETYPKIVSGEMEEDIIMDLQSQLNKVSDMYDKSKLDELDFLVGRDYEKSEVGKQRFLFKTGIPCIDGDMGGMYSGQCWTFVGPPGGGKTRFAAVQFAYQAAVFYKKDVLFDELELSKSEVENILIAHHIAIKYGGKVKIPDSVMNHNEMSVEQKQFYEAAKIDLFESGNYGRITVACKDLSVETLKQKRLMYFKMNRGTEVWIIDYLGLLTSVPTDKYAKRLMQYEVITEGIKIIKSIAKLADIGALSICQYNDEGIKASMSGKTIVPGMVEGGHIIQRHSDYDLAMTMTEEQKLARMRSLSTVKLRSAAGFSNVPLQVDMAISMFRQMKQPTV